MKKVADVTPTVEELQVLVEQLDQDGNGTVEFEEFLSLMRPRGQDSLTKGEASLLELQEAFKVFDADNSGYISVEELKQVLVNISGDVTDEEVHEIFSMCDTDGDGQISFDEFVKLAKAM